MGPDLTSRPDSDCERVSPVGDDVQIAANAAPAGPQRPGLSIIVPVYNEHRTIEELVLRVLFTAELAGWDAELIVVDDGSTDGTAEVLHRLADAREFRLLSHPDNLGKGAAIRTGLAIASKEFTIIQDADLEYDPEDISSLLQAMARDDVDVVLGSRVLGAQVGLADPRRNVYALGVVILNVAVRRLYGIRVTDEATCYKLLRTDDLRRMELSCVRFEFCPEVIAKAARMGLRLVEVPIGYSPRSTVDGKKIRLSDALTALRTLWRFRRWTPQMAVQDANASPVGTRSASG